MAVTPRLEIKQTQSLTMTPQLRQAISLLQLNNLELGELINQELETNPLLEKEDDYLSSQNDDFTSTIDKISNSSPAEDFASTDDDSSPDNDFSSETELPEDFVPDIDYNNSFDDSGADSEGFNYDNDYSWDNINRRKSSQTADDNFDYIEQKIASETSLYQILHNQIDLHFTSNIDIALALKLCEYLDDAGYFRGNTAQISAELKTSVSRINKILNILKTFEPSGIFAQNLSECLAIQMQDHKLLTQPAEIMLNNLPLLAAGKLKELQKLCNIDYEDLLSLIKQIKALNPKPAADFIADIATAVVPDVLIKRTADNSYRVELNSASLPKVLINHNYYAELLHRDKSAKRYLQENLNSATFLVRALHQRATTILRVSEEIVRLQKDFFDKGINYLKPMSLKDIAYNLEIHESTVSRVTANKFMHTSYGMFELKSFFSVAAGSYVGNEDTSTTTIKHRIKQLINQETPNHILSDDNIVELLAQNGVKIARRTVAKYREQLNIPTSAQRKRLKKELLS